MIEIPMKQVAALVAEQLPKGIFLCVGGATPNVMTIGWGGLSYFWARDVFIAPLRAQRFTYPLLEKEKAFTLCIPAPGTMARALAQAGTLSGRDGDKFAAIGLTTRRARTIDAPIIDGCAAYLECRVRARQAFTPGETDAEIIDYTYSAGDFHTLFFGEIAAAYTGDAL